MTERKRPKPGKMKGGKPFNTAFKPAAPDGSGHRARPRDQARQGEKGLWLYGTHPVRAALLNPNRTIKAIRTTQGSMEGLGQLLDQIPRSRGLPAPEVMMPEDLARRLPPGAVHQGVAVLTEPLDDPGLDAVAEPDGPALILLLDQVTDPHNVGAILRTAAAFGVRAVVATDRHAPPETGVLAKSASGAVDLVPYVRVVNLARALDDLRDFGFCSIGLADRADSFLSDFTGPQDPGPRIALVLGAEGDGLRRLTMERCDLLAKLPTRPEMPSLNVSNAAAVALYEIARRG